MMFKRKYYLFTYKRINIRGEFKCIVVAKDEADAVWEFLNKKIYTVEENYKCEEIKRI